MSMLINKYKAAYILLIILFFFLIDALFVQIQVFKRFISNNLFDLYDFCERDKG